jgi:uncharacterized protein YaiL (DUF2058 family)
MPGSLRDQLVKAGLATANQAKKAERQVRTEQQAKKRGAGTSDAAQQNAAATTDAKARARQQQREKAERDRTLARAANDKAAAKALRAEIKQIIVQNDQRVKSVSDDDVAYNFTHGKRIKRLYVPPAQRDQLSAGTLLIVNNDGHYHFLTRAAAEQVRSRDPKRIIVDNANRHVDPEPLDEHYAKFVVPDDLDW